MSEHLNTKQIGDLMNSHESNCSSLADSINQYNASHNLQQGVNALCRLQQADGSWEGEVVWCPMLVAQYVLMCHITQTPIAAERRDTILRQFATTRLPSGAWGLHEYSEPYLFVTALVYVGARILGIQPNDPLLAPAHQFIQKQGGVLEIPSWGKFWLAMLNLYDWQGLNPVLPEVWKLPEWLPVYPGNFYCHTRLIYLAMAYIYGHKLQLSLTPLLQALRQELYPQDYASVNFLAARCALRDEETYNPPSLVLKLIYQVTGLYERWHSSSLRQTALADLIPAIKFELRTSNYSSISPVSGLLNIIALWLYNPQDTDLQQAMDAFEGWIWQDEEAGLRITGARSSTWDTGFAIQALQAASPHVDVADSLAQAQAFLVTQQIQTSFPDFASFHRIDPKGGFCFAGVWHGWPVSDCTAEALIGIINAPGMTQENAQNAVQFLLRCQNADGGFGSYERCRIRSTLEWMNPAEMFASSMTERSYIECTASCIAALHKFQQTYPNLLTDKVTLAIRRSDRWLRRQQRTDGSWEGFWGVNFIYGTLFGVHGLLAAGATPQEPAIQKACAWLISKQREDGGWGEHFAGCLSQRYIEHTQSQVIHTAWALMALLQAEAPYWDAITNGAAFVMNHQLDNGGWAKQDPAGVFFHTALLDYTFYRSYFPVWALGLYESCRLKRMV
ncbi:squalene/oxidosqualene cyclase [Calothrix sp. NIES-4071]|nr:squalene/oxidosqualene cyclase [Calothrix sp. NIES-4071]BAZ57890.1 squalene/oxidosqualene cyclase [Calothrix sp. NIES-4105]